MATLRTRKVVVVDNRPLARAIGTRVRAARLRAGLTQRELAGDRYTAAYISALENGLSKPSVAALHYISERLSVDMRSLVGEDSRRWQRLDADLLLASGAWAQAADAYAALLESAPSRSDRPELLAGMAEALYRVDRATDAIGPATEAAETFRTQGRQGEEASAVYWLAAANFEVENLGEARALLQDLLARVRSGLQVTTDFRIRLLTALAMTETWDGEPRRALAYLEEARTHSSELDDVRRGHLLYSLATSYQAAGDQEAALRSGLESLALFHAAAAARDEASAENALAMTYLELGNVRQADQALARARALVGDSAEPRLAAHLTESQARILLARGKREEAAKTLERAVQLAEESGNRHALASAAQTRAHLLLEEGDKKRALASFAQAADVMRTLGSRGKLRAILTDWADALTALGRTEEANRLYREALGKS